MLTIEQALDEAYKNAGSNAYFGNGFKKGVEFAQEWINVDVKPDTPKRDEYGIFYSEYLLLKVEGYEHPFVGYYVKANDDEFFDIYPEVSEIVNQENITHYRYIDLK